MDWKRLVLALIVLLAGVGTLRAQVGALPQKDATLSETTDEKFKVGDEWEYRTRKGEEKSTLIILKIESAPTLGVIVHSIAHRPFARRALDDSVTKKIGSERALPDYEDGYDEWKEAYLKKRGGIYVIPVSKAVAVAEKTYWSGIGCQ